MSEKYNFFFVCHWAFGVICYHNITQHILTIHKYAKITSMQVHKSWLYMISGVCMYGVRQKLLYVSKSKSLWYGFKWTTGVCNPITLITTDQQCPSVSWMSYWTRSPENWNLVLNSLEISLMPLKCLPPFLDFKFPMWKTNGCTGQRHLPQPLPFMSFPKNTVYWMTDNNRRCKNDKNDRG